jgi:hypothetical protein
MRSPSFVRAASNARRRARNEGAMTRLSILSSILGVSLLAACSGSGGGGTGGATTTSTSGGPGGATTTTSSSTGGSGGATTSSSSTGGSGGATTTSSSTSSSTTSGTGGSAPTCATPWARGIIGADPANDHVVRLYATAVDTAGNIFTMGQFYGTVDLGAGPLVSSTGMFSYLLAKLDCTGATLWTKRFDASYFAIGPESLAVDANGDVVFTVTFKGTLDLGLGPLSAGPQNATLVAKFDGLGNAVWNHAYPSHDTQGLAVAPNGNVYVVGTNSDIFTLALDTNGATLWQKTFGPTNNIRVAVAPSGDVLLCGLTPPFVGGSFGGPVLVGPGLFLAKLDAAGNHIWSESFPAINNAAPVCQSIVVDATGAPVVGAWLYPGGSIDLGNGPLTTGSPSATSILVAKFSPTGSNVFGKLLADQHADRPTAEVAVDASGNIFFAGSFSGTPLDFGGGPLTPSSNMLSEFDVFVAKLGPTGTFGWAKSYGDSKSQWLGKLTLDPLGMPVVVGQFDGTIDFGSGPIAGPMASAIDPAAFVAKLAP